MANSSYIQNLTISWINFKVNKVIFVMPVFFNQLFKDNTNLQKYNELHRINICLIYKLL